MIDLNPYPLKLQVNIVDDFRLEGKFAETIQTSAGFLQVNFNKKYIKKDLIYTIAHESQHVIYMIEEYIQCALDCETKAYYLEHLMKEIQKCIKSQLSCPCA